MFILKILIVVISILAFFLSLAPFTPAIIVSLLMLCIAGVMGALKHVATSFILIAINTMAVIFSPVFGVSSGGSNIVGQGYVLAIVGIPFVVALGGAAYGLKKKVFSENT